MAEVQRDILSWDYHSIMQGRPGRALKGMGMKRVPVQFGSLREYCRVFRVLLLEELKAHLLQVGMASYLSIFPQSCTIWRCCIVEPEDCHVNRLS